MTEAPTDPQVDQQNVPADYWGTDERHKHYLPDGVQYFEFEIMNEGAKAKFQRLTNQDLTIGRDNTAKVRMDPANERHTLIKTSVVDWHLFKDGQPIKFDNGKLEKWLSVAPPKIVEELEFAIRKANPWLQADMSTEEIDKEITRLEELRREVVAREAGEGVSANK